MQFELTWENETQAIDLVEGTVRVGGGNGDDIRVEGLPHGLLTLRISGEGALVLATRSIRVGKALFPARVPRLVLEGEEVRLPNDLVLRRPVDPQRIQQRREMGTALLAKTLLHTGFQPHRTRAATLTCVTGPDLGAVFPIAFARCSIGRASDADLRLRDPAVSRRHALLVRRGRSYLISDLQATNGVLLNGIRLRGEGALRSGALIELGHTTLRFEGPAPGPDESPRAQPAPRPAAPTAPGAEKVPCGATRAPRWARAKSVDRLLLVLGAALALAGALMALAQCLSRS